MGANAPRLESAAMQVAGGRYALSRALGLALTYRVLLAAVVAAWVLAVPVRSPRPGTHFLVGGERVRSLLGDLCVAWDSYWYLAIVERGYWFSSREMSSAAFLPAYPGLTAAVARLGLSPPAAGVVASVLAFVAALVFAYHYVRELHGPRVALYTLLFVSAFPSAWVFNMVYTEALFCAALFGFLLCYQRGRYQEAGLLALALPLTRAVGLMVVPAIAADLAWTAWRTKRVPWRRGWALAGGLAGVLVVGVAYWRIAGHPLGFLQASRTWPTLTGVGGPIPFISTLLLFQRPQKILFYGSFVALYLVLAAWRLRWRRDIGSWLVLAMMAMLLSASHFSQHRYLLPLLPAHALLVEGLLRRGLAPYVLPAMVVLQLAVTRLYLDWRLVI